MAARIHRLICLLLLSQPAVLRAAAAPDDRTDFFEKRIRPLFVEHCAECHGPDKQKGNLRLDFKGGWQTGGDSGPALVPGHLETSLLWKAVNYTDRDLKMPPKKKLSDTEISDLREWIASGAADPRSDAPPAAAHKGSAVHIDGSFWSFQLPVAKPLPAVKKASWPLNDIDRFILAKLEAASLSPAPDADAETLLRRLSFDLTGLPPSHREQGKSATPLSPAEYEALVDRLIDSPAFAERWASHWLDSTRFAESSGGGRSLPFKDAWRFRDYILESIRAARPVDRMITEMVAGDLLPHANAAEQRRHLAATGFLALGPTNYEEQDKVMLRMDIVDEQIDTLGKSFLGLTIGCARCHDHKFDPIPTADYYALAGIFRSTRTIKNYTDNVAHWIDTALPLDGEDEGKLQAHEKQVAAIQAQIGEIKDALRDAGGAALRQKKAIRPADLPGIVVDDADAMKVGNWKVSKNYGPFIGQSYLHDENQGKGEKTISFAPKFPKTGRYEIRVAFIAGPGRAENVPVTILHADGEELVHFSEKTEKIEGLQFASLGAYRFEAEGQGYVLVSNAATQGYVTIDAVQFVPVESADPVLGKNDSNQKKEKDQAENPRLAALKARQAALEKELRTLEAAALKRPEAMTVTEDPAPENARIHIRGSVRNLGAEVPRGFIRVALKGSPPVIQPNQSGRLQLAEWMTSRQNPLTSRVIVNRVWHWLFGAGIVRTTDNFGSTGETPSHPELLDALAIRFMDEGWSLQRLVKHMVMSHTYRQSSTAHLNSTASTTDPDNRLLSHMNRKRLDAECLRDAILSTAGTLDTRWGGPNVGDAKAIDSNDQKIQNLEYNYPFSDTRRSLYTAAFRNVRHPLFEVFDFADINQPISQRTTSTVATQALFLMNHPFIIEQARAAATQAQRQPGADEDRIRWIYQASLDRDPTSQEAAISKDFLESSLSGNATAADINDTWARLIQTLWSTPDFRFLR